MVVTFLDGTVHRGRVESFNPGAAGFFFYPDGAPPGAKPKSVSFDEVKTVGFVHSAAVPAGQTRFPVSAKLVTVRFQDGQVGRGVTLTYAEGRKGIFLVPTTEDNYERIFIPISAVREILSVQKLGEIMTEKGMVTPEMVEKAIAKQQQDREQQIGEILVKKKLISEEQLNRGLQIQEKREGKKIGEILLEQGFIERIQLEEALEIQQRQRNRRLGEILVEMGYATYKMIAVAMAIQYHVPFIDFAYQVIDPRLKKIVPLETARRLRIMPLSLQEKILTIAVTDPSDHEARDTLRDQTGLTVIADVATPPDIARAIKQYYAEPAVAWPD